MRAFLLAASLAVAGCAQGDLAGFGPEVRGGGGGLPATRAQARSDAMTPPGRRELGLAVRAFAAETDGTRVEIRGATCRITAGALTATLTTPGRLVLPDLGPDAPAVRADCVAGTLEGAAAAAPVFAWAGGGGAPPQRVLWGMGWTYGFEAMGPVSYPNLSVALVGRAG
jgi:hypothetical protein